MSEASRIITHINCPKPATSGKFLAGGPEGPAYSQCWPLDERPANVNPLIGEAEFYRCEGCEAILADEGNGAPTAPEAEPNIVSGPRPKDPGPYWVRCGSQWFVLEWTFDDAASDSGRWTCPIHPEPTTLPDWLDRVDEIGPKVEPPRCRQEGS